MGKPLFVVTETRQEYADRQADKLFVKIIGWILMSGFLSVSFSPLIALFLKGFGVNTTNFSSFEFMFNVGFVFFLTYIFTAVFKSGQITSIFKVIRGFLYMIIGIIWLVFLIIDLIMGTHTLISKDNGFVVTLIFALISMFLVYKGYKNVDSYSNIFKIIINKFKKSHY